ncbi:MAG TPA: putative 2OG-Fe(II) oxygenase [Allosphingosinicella sp.]|nr:putative 2OG-Fe(II) oxygenase [Allosphingosinicella sp.]
MIDLAATFAAAERAFSSGDPQGAVRLIGKIEPLITPDAALFHLKALALKQAGRDEESLTAFQQASRLAPADAAIANNQANLLDRMGRKEAALQLYDRAIALQPAYRDARYNKALLLQSLGRDEEALKLVEALCADDPADAPALATRGSILLKLERHDEAERSFRGALARRPNLPSALAGRARLGLERQEAGAPAHYEEALRARPGDLNLVLGLAEALELNGDPLALDLLEHAVGAHPGWLGGLAALARMRSEAGESDFTRDVRAALGRGGDDQAILLLHARLLAQADRPAEAAEVLERATGGADVALTRALYLGDAGEAQSGLDLLASVGARDRPNAELVRGRLSLQMGDMDAAIAALTRAVELDPYSISAWGHLELAWRLTGHERSQWLSGQPNLFAARDIDLSPGEIADTADFVRTLHRAQAHPVGQSLRGGTQTRGRLLLRQEPQIRRLFEALAEAVERHRAELPTADPRHPLLRHRDRSLRIAGSWSVRLTDAGFHVHHIHPEGVLSSACYLAVPEALGSAAGREGWLELGRPPKELRLDLEPLATIEPEPGRLVLFPSYLFHGTRPFHSGERLTVAFDVVLAQ